MAWFTKKPGMINSYSLMFLATSLFYLTTILIPNSYAEDSGLPEGIQDRIGSSTIDIVGNTMTHTTQDMKRWGDANSFNIGAIRF